MLSNYSQNAVGAVGNASQIMFLFIILFNVIAGATGVVVAQYLGARRTDNMNPIYSLAVNIVNIVGNWTFLYGPLKYLRLGVAGVFMGTAADEGVRAIIALIRWKKGSWMGKTVVR